MIADSLLHVCRDITVSLGALHGWVYVPQWEPLFRSFIDLGIKLEKLGFREYKGKITLVPVEEAVK